MKTKGCFESSPQCRHPCHCLSASKYYNSGLYSQGSYSASAYEVTEKITDKTLLITLTDPEGNNYRYESVWMYAPEYMQEDVWYISLTGSGLTYSLDQNGYPHGEYQMAYYVDGDLADAFTFELK